MGSPFSIVGKDGLVELGAVHAAATERAAATLAAAVATASNSVGEKHANAINVLAEKHANAINVHAKAVHVVGWGVAGLGVVWALDLLRGRRNITALSENVKKCANPLIAAVVDLAGAT